MNNQLMIQNNIELMERAYKMSELMATSDIIPIHYRGKPANVFIALQSAFRMNLDPMAVMQNTFVIGGKLGMLSSFAISLANGSGIFDSGIRYKIEGSGEDLKVTAFAHLKQNGNEISYTVSMKDAIAEGWTKNVKYRTLPELMLRYRAATLLIRTHVPEVLNGMHTVDEYEDIKPVNELKSANKPDIIINKIADIADKIDHEKEDKSELIKDLTDLIREKEVDTIQINNWLEKAKVSSLEELTALQINALINFIKNKTFQNN